MLIPDRGVLYPGQTGVYASPAALAIEILSPDDETAAKLPLYAAHDVAEVDVAADIDWPAVD